MHTLWQDLRFALRGLRSDRAFTASVLAMLALGLAASVAMFSVLRGVVLGALPFPDAPRVLSLTAVNAPQGVRDGNLTTAEAVRLTQAPTPFEAVGFYTWSGVTVIEGDEPREITINRVSAGFFPALGLQPLHGRAIQPADTAAGAAVAVLSYVEWQRLFGGDPAAIGRKIDTDDGAVEVIGVMPPAFAFPATEVGAWLPVPDAAIDRARPGYWQARFVAAVGRLATGVSAAELDARLEAIGAELRATHSLRDAGWRIAATPVLDELVGSVRPVLWGAFAIALLVLLIACVNSAILLEARSIRQARELAIAQALGAGAGRLRRVRALELGLLIGAAATAGVLLIVLVLDRFRALAADSLPRTDAIAVDAGVLAFAGVAGLVALFCIVLQGWRLGGAPADALRRAGTGLGSRSATRRRRWLPALGIALSTIAVVSAVALALSLIAMQSLSPGFRSQDVYVLQMFRDSPPAQWGGFAEQVQERLRALPGVEAAAVTTSVPMSGIGSFVVDLQAPGAQQDEPLQASLRRVSAGYLDLLDIPVLEGRAFGGADRSGSEPVTIVSRTLARRLFGDASPLERMVDVPLGGGPPTPHRIVGVMDDIRNDSLRDAPQPELLVPFAQSPWVGMAFLVRGATLDASVLKAMQATIWSLDPREGITRAFALEEDRDAQLRPNRLFAATIGVFALVSLVLGALGVYAVTAFVQRARSAEYGLRLAIGAPPRAMARAVLGETAVMLALGLSVGLVGAWLALQLLSGQLFEVGAADVEAYAAATLAIAATAVLATLTPAWRAARVDPMRALRGD